MFLKWTYHVSLVSRPAREPGNEAIIMCDTKKKLSVGLSHTGARTQRS